MIHSMLFNYKQKEKFQAGTCFRIILMKKKTKSSRTLKGKIHFKLSKENLDKKKNPSSF